MTANDFIVVSWSTKAVVSATLLNSSLVRKSIGPYQPYEVGSMLFRITIALRKFCMVTSLSTQRLEQSAYEQCVRQA